VEGAVIFYPWREGMGSFGYQMPRQTVRKSAEAFLRTHIYARRNPRNLSLLPVFFTQCKSYLELYRNTWEWMSGASRGHAAPSFPSPQPSEMGDATRGPRRRFDEALPQTSKTGAFHSDNAGMVTRGPGNVKPELDKRSLDYILRSGLAGALAGCAVWRRPPCPLPSY
jgi:hypothetical protein